MTIEIKVPVLPESVQDATIATWYKKPGDVVAQDDNLVDIETDKVVLEVVAPQAGILEKIIKSTGETVLAEEVIGIVTPGAQGANANHASVEAQAQPAAAPAASKMDNAEKTAGPAARRMMAEHDIAPETVQGSGKGGRVTTQDVKSAQAAPQVAKQPAAPITLTGDRPEKRVPMTRLRTRIAERLLSAQHNAAILTTFNEINMKPVMDLRNRYKDQFEKQHGVKLGFMSFFTKAVIEALKRFPVVNASLDGTDMIYHGYFDIGVAVSSPRGLVVPVLRDADKLSLAGIEKSISALGMKAKEGTLSIEEMTGGTFTISNGGVFGSLLSTPILNPPQTGILGMHKIEERPVVEKGEIVIRPMMYVALSYDHRMIDGAESVRFLVTIKDLIEDPARLLLDI
ncbi:2-oxoglutarate dehydrogenase complex dihydrolipoyllysine-residue succinyltransferase [Candidatus Berkiella cookevillensis]|uniref:Dihydrolipoyllysine-residue succinyltransferase component of 2-oxoglutarate dehydrogenase complex n=1 Tax=Candidatus Berkiella cookevillensis TaxID=437022 RepID=A0A0Q9YBJ4_9GAMM|nr:2-oxoglutarate dehydrogenase complex dihydrolipoyllysine-residue succinyltransferase [Candidatus Berkiella cookevillensis]MCS5709083.1 2-oxoglutarate dehydrogenase complex dihydrolipoyllysine-residue succinyltransferase [Candidatus Berkiella cookevillensis]